MSRALAMLRAAEAASWDWSGASRAAEATYDESKHDRGGAGTSTGGQFVSMGEHSGSRIADARDGPKPPGQRKPPARGNPGKPPVKPSAKKPAPGKPKPKTAAGLTEPATPRRLKLGDTGADVQRLQTLLRGLGIDAHLNADGTFSDATKAAVMEAQRKLGVKRPNGRASVSFMRKLADAVKLSPCIREAALLDLADRVLERFDPSQPRIDAGLPGGGRWLDLTPDGPVTPGRVAEIFGELLDEDALTDDLNFHVSLHDGHGGRVVLTQDAGDGQRRVLAHWGPNDAQALANQVREMAESAREYENEDDPDPADYAADTSVDATPDGTYAELRPDLDNPVWVRPGGRIDDESGVALDPDQADEFADKLEELADGAATAAEQRRDREETEREEERDRLTEEREKLVETLDEINDVAGGNGLENVLSVRAADTGLIEIESAGPSATSWGVVKADDLPEIAAGLRELEEQRAGLPEWGADLDEDDEEIEPNLVDEFDVRDGMSLQLYEDGDYRLAIDDKDGRPYETVLWGASAMELADKLDAVHEQVAAGKAALAAFDAEHGAQLAEAYEPHSGAMIALVPSREDAERLADADDGAEGALPVDELHVTLAYLGKAASFGPDARADVMNRVRAAFRGLGPVEARGFNIALFNPGGEEPCIVLGMGGEGLSEAHTAAGRALKGIDYPDPHEPWCAHLTLAYTGDASRVEDYTDRVGPVVFDRVRVAFGGEVFDLPLRGARAAESWREQLRDAAGRWIDMGDPIVRKVFKFGGTEVGVSAHADGSRTLDFPGGHSVRLEDDELRGFSRGRRASSLRALSIYTTEHEVGRGGALSRVWGNVEDGPPRKDLLLGVKVAAEAPDLHPNGDPDEETWDLTTLSLHLPPNDDPSYAELMDSPPVAVMKAKDLYRLAEIDLPAARAPLGDGHVDIYRDGGKVVFRSSGSEPVALDRKGARSLHDAIDRLWDDDERDARPDAETVERVVSTKAGDVTVRMTGEGTLTEVTGVGLSLRIRRDELLAFIEALGEADGSAREAVSVTRSVEMIRVAENWMDQIRDWRGQWAEMGLALRRGPEPDVRYGTGRTVTRGGSVISSRLPTRKPRANDRVRDASNPRRMGTVVQVSPKVDSRYIRPGETEVRAGQLHEPDMRVQWDDGKVETLPQERLSDPLADPPRWFDAASTPAAPKLDAGSGGPRTAAERVSGAIASGAVVGKERRDVLDTVRRSAGMPTSSREPKSLSDLMQMVRDGDITQTDAEHYLASGDLPMSTPPRARKAASTSPAVARVAKAKAAKAPAEAPGAVRARLDAANTREDAHAALAGLKVAELREVARATGTSLVGASRAADMRTRIVEHTVGFRLNSQVIRGGSWANDPVPAAPVPTKRAPRKPKAPAIPPTERLAAISALGSREEAHAALDFVRKAELVEMARELSVPNAGSLSMQQLREWIVEGAVGRSLDSAAIRRLDAVRS